MAILRRSTRGTGPADMSTVLATDQLAASHPAFVEFMALSSWPEDGTPRALGTYKLFYDDGCFKAFLNDHAQRKYACVSADSLTGLLDVIEAVLTDDSIEWRVSNYEAKGKGKKG